MRLTFALAGLSALAFATAAGAEQVSLTPVAYSPEFQTALNRDLGEREGVYLSNDMVRAISDAITRHGATFGENGLSIEISIISAAPNRPTMHQLLRRPELDAGRTVAVGGAEYHAVIKAADGRTLSEVTHRLYNYSLDDLVGPPTTWTTAERAIDQFAEKVADAYDAQTHAQ
ncbi:MAG TPA: hypothetical protein VHC73_15005 [Vitreimonas sp.]|jgi:hypothetical protein|nr:hypothetical protein [Vitreimonas sp.]